MDLQLSVPVTTNVVCPNPAHGDVYSIQHYVIKFVCDLLRFPPPIKLTTTENSVENGIKHHILYLTLTLQERVCNNNEFFFLQYVCLNSIDKMKIKQLLFHQNISKHTTAHSFGMVQALQ